MLLAAEITRRCCMRVKELRETERRIGEDYMNLLRTLAG